jgi:epoxyqueuosine reductase
MTSYHRGWIGRRIHQIQSHLVVTAGRRLQPLVDSRLFVDLLSRIPVVPTKYVPRLRSPGTAWQAPSRSVPPELLTRPGIKRDAEAEEAAFAKAPLFPFFTLHSEVKLVLMKHWAFTFASVSPRLFGATRRLKSIQNVDPVRTPAEQIDTAELTRELKSEAARLGISATGVAQYDEKFTFAGFEGLAVGDRVVVCILEQNFGATQRVPSLASERAALSTYGELEDRLSALAQWLRNRGYKARPETFEGESLHIHYGVAAGLGQLGMNGQLLTPQAGSRCRINILTTDAPLDFDAPVDYGIEGVCDKCQICVRRCPVGAIPNRRKEYRGVTKAKLNTKRCLPVMLQTEGCSICMKVCPVQRYGLDAVLEEYESTGEIIGKETDDLEGYDWPLDGNHYGPGESPRVPNEVVAPPGFHLDPSRLIPITSVNQRENMLF